MNDPGTGRFLSALAVLRLKPFETATQQGRSRERIRRAALTSVTSAVSRVLSMATPLVTIPLALGYLGRETYGLWMTISSVVGMFMFADFGLGSGLLTSLSRAHGRGDLGACRRLVSTGAFLLLGIALALGFLLLVVWQFIPWPAVLNAQTPAAAAVATGIVAASAFCFLLNLPLATVQRAQMALQEGFRSDLWQCLGSMLAMLAVVGAVSAKLNPALFVLAVTGAPLLATLGNGVWFFHRTTAGLRPSLRAVSWIDGSALLRSGFWFFALAVVSTAGLYADNLIVAHVCGLEAVVKYSVPARLAAMLNVVVMVICSPMWAANGEALARGDVDWVRRNTERLLMVSVGLTSGCAILFAVAGPSALRLWLGTEFEVPLALLMGLGANAMALSLTAPFFMVLNGANVIRPQVLVFLLFTPVAIFAKVMAGRHFGFAGLPWAGTLSYLLIVVFPVIRLSQLALQRHERETSKCPSEGHL